MSDDQQTPCDADDLMCEFRVLGHLRGLRREMGGESFKTRFPDLSDIASRVTGSIDSQKATLRDSMERCGIPIPEELAPAAAQAAEAEPSASLED